MGKVEVIHPEQWIKEEDGKWYIHIPFECDPDTDTIMEFTDDSDYIDEHKDDFDALNNGTTEDGMCTISADHKPECEMKIEIKTLDEAGGRIMYDKNGNPEYIPEQSSFGGLFGALGGMMGGQVPPEIIDATTKVVEEPKQIETKDE